MGGMGSGRRWHYGTKDTTGDYRAIDVRRWYRDRLLDPGHAFGWQWTRDGEAVASIQVRVELPGVRLIYRHRSGESDWKDENYLVQLDWTPCKFGGQRPWFRCPARGCGRRSAILYGGAIFACRRCYRLVYPSQNEREPERFLRRARKIRSRASGDGDLTLPFPPKPKGMWSRTYQHLRQQGLRAEMNADNAFMSHMSKLVDRIDNRKRDRSF